VTESAQALRPARLKAFLEAPPVDLSTVLVKGVGRPKVIVIAGGSSSRFGSDKLLVLIDGRPLISRVLEVAREVGDVILVSSRDEISRLGGLLGDVKVVEDLPRLPCGGPPRGVQAPWGR
jgi:Molybdopterin-guanine dinucleotide biosynthesis protein A